jgi:hypothetical protein
MFEIQSNLIVLYYLHSVVQSQAQPCGVGSTFDCQFTKMR